MKRLSLSHAALTIAVLALPAAALAQTATPPAPTMAPMAAPVAAPMAAPAASPMAAPMAGAASTPMAAPATQAKQTTTATQTAVPIPPLPKADEIKLNAHIKALHDQLKITTAEEPQWEAFATVMRTNDADMHQAFQARAKVATMSAPDNMQSYAAIAQMHANGMQKLSAAFTTLYNAFPPAQQKLADSVFQKATHAMKH